MGLDISYYESFTPLPTPPTDEEKNALYDQDYTLRLFTRHFPKQAEGLPLDGTFIRTHGKSGCFWAGSYHGYGAFRQALCQLAYNLHIRDFWANDLVKLGLSTQDSIPFKSILNFSDCEGQIGPVASALLAQDFQDYMASAEAAWGGEQKNYLSLYKQFADAFTVAARGGLVHFY